MSMNNFFKQKQVEELKQQETQRQAKQKKHDQIRKAQSVQLKARADHRLETFQETQLSKQYVDSMKKGTYPLLPTEKHSFRDRFKAKEMDQTGGITVKTFHVAGKRAELAMEDFKEGHLKLDKFDANLPHKNHGNWLRIDDASKERPPLRFGLNERIEGHRVNNQIDKLSHQLDTEKRDIKMLILPSWKDEQKDKWLDKKTFNIYPCKYEGHRSNPPWIELPINLNNQNNQYIDGFEVTGDLSRKQEKEKEFKRAEFCSTIKEDQIGTTIHISRSLRTMKADAVLGCQANFDEYSKNQHLTFYKSSLIQTKSVDHTTPHQHSNNYKGLALQNLRPETDSKFYRLSINMSKQQIITKLPPNSAELKTAAKTEVPMTPENLANKLTNIQEVSQYGIQSASNLPQSRESLNSRTTKSRFMNGYKTRVTTDGQMKLGYPYHQEDDQTTNKIVGKYFKE